MFQRAGLKKCSQAGGSGREARGGQQSPPAAWCGVPCSPLAGAGRGVTSGNVEASVVPDFGEGLENT